MTLSPPPVDPADAYAVMSPLTLLAHLEAIAEQLRTQGVEITPVAQLGIDELAEAVVDHVGRTDKPALHAYLARLQAEAAPAAVARPQRERGATAGRA